MDITANFTGRGTGAHPRRRAATTSTATKANTAISRRAFAKLASVPARRITSAHMAGFAWTANARTDNVRTMAIAQEKKFAPIRASVRTTKRAATTTTTAATDLFAFQVGTGRQNLDYFWICHRYFFKTAANLYDNVKWLLEYILELASNPTDRTAPSNSSLFGLSCNSTLATLSWLK